MKASEARELARKLASARKEAEEKSIAPLLNDPDVEAEIKKIYESIKAQLEVDPCNVRLPLMSLPFTGLKEKALFKRLKDDGYNMEKRNDGIVIDWWD